VEKKFRSQSNNNKILEENASYKHLLKEKVQNEIKKMNFDKNQLKSEIHAHFDGYLSKFNNSQPYYTSINRTTHFMPPSNILIKDSPMDINNYSEINEMGDIDISHNNLKLNQSKFISLTQIDEPHDLLGKQRNRSIKNNKIVFSHRKGTNDDDVSSINNDNNLSIDEHPSSMNNFNDRKEVSYIRANKNTIIEKPRGSQYRGVSRNGNQWQVLIMVSKKKRYVGSYSNEIDAAKAYDRAALQNHGDKAKTNFDYTETELHRIMQEPKILK
jgi:hypothetical protein